MGIEDSWFLKACSEDPHLEYLALHSRSTFPAPQYKMLIVRCTSHIAHWTFCVTHCRYVHRRLHHIVYCTSHIASVGRRFETASQTAQLHIVYCTDCTLRNAHHTIALTGRCFETASHCITGTKYIVHIAHCVLYIVYCTSHNCIDRPPLWDCITVHHSASQCITSTIKSSWSISGLCAALINQKCLIFWSCWKRVMCQNDCKEIFCGLQELSLINKCLHGVEREIFWWWKEGNKIWKKKHADTNARSLST